MSRPGAVARGQWTCHRGDNLHTETARHDRWGGGGGGGGGREEWGGGGGGCVRPASGQAWAQVEREDKTGQKMTVLWTDS